MPKKCKLTEIPPAELPETYNFFYARVSTKLMLKAEKKREHSGHTVRHMLEKMCELYIKDGNS